MNNSCVREVINDRLPTGAGRTKIPVTCPLLREFFTTSTFEIDLSTGQVHRFLLPPEDIGVPYQQEEFDLNLLRKWLQGYPDPVEHDMDELKRIPLVRKTAAAADIMDLQGIEEKVDQ